MSKATVLGNGPVVLTAQDGHLLEIPLTALIFDNGIIGLSSPIPYTPKYQGEIVPWIHYLSNAGFLSAGAPLAAMVIQAVQPGSMGNTIKVSIDKVTLATNLPDSTIDMTITETDQYVGLSYDPASPSFIKTILGTNKLAPGTAKPTPGMRPGLVLVNDADIPDLPLVGDDYKLTGGDGTTPSSVVIPKVVAAPKADAPADAPKADAPKSKKAADAPKVDPAFTLVSRAPGDGDGGGVTKVTIKGASASTKTFTLIATWTKQITGTKLSDLATTNYDITIKPAPGLDTFPYLPALGSIQLSGGSDVLAGQTATATVLAQ